MGELLALASCWLRHRQVRRAAAFVALSTVAVLSLVGWRVVADGGRHGAVAHAPVPAAQLVVGHRYVLVPWIVLTLLAVGVAGSVASSDAAYGLTASVAVRRPGLGRSLARQVLAAAMAAMVWFALAAWSVVLAAAVVLVALGRGGGVDAALLVTGLRIVLRLDLVVGLLSLASVTLGLALPTSALPAVAVPVLVLIAEVALQLLTGGRAALVPGGSLAVLAVGSDALGHGMAPPWVAVAVPVAVAITAPAVASIGIAVIVRLRPPPS